MTPLTDEQRGILEANWPAISRIAGGYSGVYHDDEFLGFVAEYLCGYVTRFDPARGPASSWAKAKTRMGCLEYLDSRRRRRIPVEPAEMDSLPGRCPGDTLEGREQVAAIMGVLTPRERRVVEESVFGGRPMEDIGADLGITGSGASRVKLRAFAKMRERMAS